MLRLLKLKRHEPLEDEVVLISGLEGLDQSLLQGEKLLFHSWTFEDLNLVRQVLLGDNQEVLLVDAALRQSAVQVISLVEDEVAVDIVVKTEPAVLICLLLG